MIHEGIYAHTEMLLYAIEPMPSFPKPQHHPSIPESTPVARLMYLVVQLAFHIV